MVLTAAVLFFLTYLIGKKAENKVEIRRKCGIFFWIREKEEERDACKI